MKTARLLTILGWVVAGGSTAVAQVDIPRNPVVRPGTAGGFKGRSTGNHVDPGATITEKPENVRYVTHVVLFDYRMWSNSEGKPLEAKLIGFEDLVVEAPKGTEPKMPAPPARPTVIKDGKVRLLVNNKPAIVPMDKLSVGDQEFVKDIDAAIARKQQK